MTEHGDKIWKNGEIVDWKVAGSTSLLTHTLHYGVGAFEGIRAYRRGDGNTSIFRLQDHIVRLAESCHLVMMKPRVTVEQIVDGCLQVLRENSMSEGYLRPLVTIGAGAMGVYAPNNPIETYIIAWKWGAYLGAEALDRGIRCKVSSFSRHHINVAFAKGKLVGQYINSVMAKQEAKLDGFDEAILTDVNGYVSEGSGENVFIVKKGVLTTPPLSASILAGITRETIITLAREEGLTVKEEYITRDELYLADEVFLTGTAAEVTPVVEVDHRVIGTGQRGEVTRRLQARYFDIVKGKDDSHPEWLTRV
ncbi:MAG: branched-chain amino acid transaminase [Polyangiaceae bacterium]|nr:branched-chain amino acid transaminase [Polyangiaceae bacterium]